MDSLPEAPPYAPPAYIRRVASGAVDGGGYSSARRSHHGSLLPQNGPAPVAMDAVDTDGLTVPLVHQRMSTAGEDPASLCFQPLSAGEQNE